MSSKIEWTDETWNPVTGCTKVSQGCKHCYAEREWPRMSAPRPKPNVYTGRKFTDVQCHAARLDQPLRWREPRKIFVNSMSDLFHEDVPDYFIDQVFAVMAGAENHTFQVLTKRQERMREYCNRLYTRGHDMANTFLQVRPKEDADGWYDFVQGRIENGPLPNVWLGVSVEDQETANERIPILLDTPAAIRFISAEPLLGPIKLDDIEHASGEFFNALDLEEWTDSKDSPEVKNSPCAGALIDQVIVGGESGYKNQDIRPMHPDWVRSLRDQCQIAGASYFMKQWGEFLPHCQSGPDQRSNPVEFKSPNNPEKMNTYYRLGKKAAGRELDGVIHDEMPNKSTTAEEAL